MFKIHKVSITLDVSHFMNSFHFFSATQKSKLAFTVQLNIKCISPTLNALRFSSCKVIPRRTTNYGQPFQIDRMPHSTTPALNGTNTTLRRGPIWPYNFKFDNMLPRQVVFSQKE
jgi:hypothetical protein